MQTFIKFMFIILFQGVFTIFITAVMFKLLLTTRASKYNDVDRDLLTMDLIFQLRKEKLKRDCNCCDKCLKKDNRKKHVDGYLTQAIVFK